MLIIGWRLKIINIKYNNSFIECVQKYTYLGVVFNTSGSFTTSKQEIHKKDNKARSPLTEVIPKFEDFVLTPKINLQNFVWIFSRTRESVSFLISLSKLLIYWLRLVIRSADRLLEVLGSFHLQEKSSRS
jgi:hypothetical protein